MAGPACAALAAVLPRLGCSASRFAPDGSAVRSAIFCPRASLARSRSPASLPAPSAVDRPQVFAAQGERRARVALLSGCAQQVLAPQIGKATVRL